MKKDNNTVEKLFAVNTTMAQHAAILNSRGLATLRLPENPDIILIKIKIS